jgi:hypothetical protein
MTVRVELAMLPGHWRLDDDVQGRKTEQEQKRRKPPNGRSL